MKSNKSVEVEDAGVTPKHPNGMLCRRCLKSTDFFVVLKPTPGRGPGAFVAVVMCQCGNAMALPARLAPVGGR